MQNSGPSFAVRYGWECSCGAWGTAGIEDQAIKAIDAHIKLGEQGCGEYELIKIEIA